jgi:hypothetical protein
MYEKRIEEIDERISNLEKEKDRLEFLEFQSRCCARDDVDEEFEPADLKWNMAIVAGLILSVIIAYFA